jgi:hypothetical protein
MLQRIANVALAPQFAYLANRLILSAPALCKLRERFAASAPDPHHSVPCHCVCRGG